MGGIKGCSSLTTPSFPFPRCETLPWSVLMGSLPSFFARFFLVAGGNLLCELM